MKDFFTLTSICVICSGCFIDEIIQPNSVSNNQELTVYLTVVDNIGKNINA